MSSKKIIEIEIEEYLLDRLEFYSEKESVVKSEIIEEAIEEYLSEHNEKTSERGIRSRRWYKKAEEAHRG